MPSHAYDGEVGRHDLQHITDQLHLTFEGHIHGRKESHLWGVAAIQKVQGGEAVGRAEFPSAGTVA